MRARRPRKLKAAGGVGVMAGGVMRLLSPGKADAVMAWRQSGGPRLGRNEVNRIKRRWKRGEVSW